MNWQDYETISHIELKGKLIEYLKERTTEVKKLEQDSEYEYCEVQGRIKELEELTRFIDTFKRPAL